MLFSDLKTIEKKLKYVFRQQKQKKIEAMEAWFFSCRGQSLQANGKSEKNDS